MIDTAFPGHFQMFLEKILPEPQASSVQAKSSTVQLSITLDLSLYHFNYFSLKRNPHYFAIFLVFIVVKLLVGD